MAYAPKYRFQCSVVDATTGETVSSRQNIDIEYIDEAVGSLLRTFANTDKAKHEDIHYPKENAAE